MLIDIITSPYIADREAKAEARASFANYIAKAKESDDRIDALTRNVAERHLAYDDNGDIIF